MQAFETAVMNRELDHDGMFDYLVSTGKILPAEEVARFNCPDLEDPRMLWGSAEFIRWYMADGTKRVQPLDYDELVEYITLRDRCSNLDAEREVCLNSLARKGDREVWSKIVSLGYLELTRIFAEEEFGALFVPATPEMH